MLNIKHLSTLRFFNIISALVIFALFFNFSCGKRKPPLPPIDKVNQRAEISGTQRGNIISLSWELPNRNTSDASTQNISRVDIYRLTETVNSPLVLTEEEFASRSVLISTLEISDEDFQRKQIVFNDKLEFAGQNVRLRYAIRFVNSSGQKASFSNFLLFEPTTQIAGSPNMLVGRLSADSIQLEWKAPAENIDGSKPANILGFNVYRTIDNSEKPEVINKSPVLENNFQDKFFEFDKKYKYFVRTISLGVGGEPIESLNSNVFEIETRDIFPPAAPSALTIAAAPNALSIFFAANSEKDLAGYRVFRSTNRDLPLQNWDGLTKELITTNTFQDKNITSGVTYFYYILAIDNKGNVSQASEIISETAP